MKPLTQKVLLAALAVVSIGTTGLVLVKGAIENASYHPEDQAQLASANGEHVHQHHGAPAGIILSPKSDHVENFGPAPAFTMINQNGVPVTLDTFKGKAVIASFIFTRCPGPCPLISSQMSVIARNLAKGPNVNRVALVSFSVDPDYDTPPVLTEYAKRYEADTNHWSFITGDRADMWKLIGKGFKLALLDQPDDKVSPILHSTKLVLIDPQGQVRGYYDALDQDSRNHMLAQLKKVLAEKPTNHTGDNVQ